MNEKKLEDKAFLDSIVNNKFQLKIKIKKYPFDIDPFKNK